MGKLNELDDLRYHITWTFGGYIEDIPKRIGRNNALDAATAALVTTHSTLRLNRESNRPIPAEAFQKYSHAIRALREYLDIPARARESETLCAVSLLSICAYFLGERGSRSYHGEGAAQILKARAYYDPRDDFEQKLLLSLRGTVLFEALVNPRVQFTPPEWKLIVENKLDESDRPEGMMLRHLARAPDLMHRGRIALREQTGLQMLVFDARCLYQSLTTMLGGLRDRYCNTQTSDSTSTAATTSRAAITIAMINCHYQRTYGFGVLICMIFNCILKALDTDAVDLDVDAKYFCKETLKLANEAAKYRPLCASYIQLCLVAAWSCSDDKATKEALEKWLVDYSSDFTTSPEDTVETRLKETCRTLRLLDP